MKRFRNILSLVVIVLMAFILVRYFNYNDLSWAANNSSYIALLTGIFILIANIGSNLHEAKKGDSKS